MSKLMTKLRASGYSRTQRWEILKSGSRKFNRMVKQEEGGVRRVNRPRWEGRYVNKLLKKKNWYKQKRGQERSEGCGSSRQENANSREERDSTEPETVIFIPSTPRGELLKLMKESDSQFRKGSGRAGISIQDTLVSSNPWGDLKCGRANCFVCKSERGGISMCMKESVTYSI